MVLGTAGKERDRDDSSSMVYCSRCASGSSRMGDLEDDFGAASDAADFRDAGRCSGRTGSKKGLR